MSLCIVLRNPNGGVMMAADTAVSTEIKNKPYRVVDMADDEKIIEHNGALIFCSGDLEKCERIRTFIRQSAQLNLVRVSEYARKLFGNNPPDNTGILVCWEDGSLVGMLSAQNFRLTPIPWDRGGVDFFTLGINQKRAYELTDRYLHSEIAAGENGGVQVIARTYFELSSECIGGNIHVFSRTSPTTPWKSGFIEMDERDKSFRQITKAEALATHGIVYAQDFYLGNKGEYTSSLLTDDKTKIRGEYIDARGINIMDAQGHQVLYIDQTGIHWTPKYSPFKYQYSTSANGPWHDTPADSDVYRRESCDGGITWGAGIKFIARDGKNGSDANVTYDNIKKALQKAASTQTSFITADEMGAPIIYGGKIYGAEMYANQFNIHTENGGRQGAFSVWGDFLGIPYEMFRIDYFAGDAPYVHLYSPAKGYMSIGYGGGRVTMDGRIDFSNAAGIEWGKHAPKAVFA